MGEKRILYPRVTDVDGREKTVGDTGLVEIKPLDEGGPNRAYWPAAEKTAKHPGGRPANKDYEGMIGHLAALVIIDRKFQNADEEEWVKAGCKWLADADRNGSAPDPRQVRRRVKRLHSQLFKDGD